MLDQLNDLSWPGREVKRAPGGHPDSRRPGREGELASAESSGEEREGRITRSDADAVRELRRDALKQIGDLEASASNALDEHVNLDISGRPDLQSAVEQLGGDPEEGITGEMFRRARKTLENAGPVSMGFDAKEAAERGDGRVTPLSPPETPAQATGEEPLEPTGAPEPIEKTVQGAEQSAREEVNMMAWPQMLYLALESFANIVDSILDKIADSMSPRIGWFTLPVGEWLVWPFRLLVKLFRALISPLKSEALEAGVPSKKREVDLDSSFIPDTPTGPDLAGSDDPDEPVKSDGPPKGFRSGTVRVQKNRDDAPQSIRFLAASHRVAQAVENAGKNPATIPNESASQSLRDAVSAYESARELRAVAEIADGASEAVGVRIGEGGGGSTGYGDDPRESAPSPTDRPFAGTAPDFTSAGAFEKC